MKPGRPPVSEIAERSPLAVLRDPRQLFYGWWIVGAGVAINAMIASLFQQAYGTYVVLLRQEFGWSNTMLSAGFSVVQATNGTAAPVQGWLTDRFGPRAVIRVGLVLFALGLMFFSQVRSPYMLFPALFVIAVGLSLGGFLSLVVAIVNWFERYRATAISFLTGGFALGGVLVVITIQALDAFGWRAVAFGSGVLVLAVGIPVAQLVRHRPEDYGLEVDGGPRYPAPADGPDQPAEIPHAASGFTVRQAVRTRAFWFVSLGHGFALLVISAVQVHLVAHLNEELGYSLGFASVIIAIITTSQVVGTFGGGIFGDRLNKRVIAIVAMLVQGGGLLLLASVTATWLIVLFAVAHGLAWGVRGPVMLAIRADYFGRRDFGKIMGLSQLVMTTGLVGGPLVAGIIADQTGDFRTGFTVLGVLAAAGSIFFVLASKPLQPGLAR